MGYLPRFYFSLLTVLVLCLPASSQNKLPVETRNAALRYWTAFAELQETAMDKSTAELLTKTLAGETPWDESALGPLVSDNQDSIQILQRATKLPECDWGLEYSLGPQTPIPFLHNSARALARLNLLYGIRQAAQGDTQAALDAWLAGIRFSHHLSQGQSLLGNLVAASIFRSNLHILFVTAKNHSFNTLQKKQIEKALNAMPESGFDWGEAMNFEAVATNAALKQFAASPNQAALYQEWYGTPPPANFSLPKSSEAATYNVFISYIVEALRMDPAQAQSKLEQLEAAKQSLNPFFANSIPSLVRINETRRQIQSERQQLLNQLALPPR